MNTIKTENRHKKSGSQKGGLPGTCLLPAQARSHSRQKGMTLVEVIVATTVAGLVGAAVLAMTLTLGKTNFDSTAKLLINNDVRSFTSELSRAARSSRDFRIYASASNLAERSSGETGDVLVLLWAQPESIEDAVMGTPQEYYYEKIIIFSRVVDNEEANTGPVMLYERNFALPSATSGGTAASDTVIADLTAATMADTSSSTKVSEVIQLTRGLAEEKLFFYSRLGRSITVNGELYHGNDARRVTNTYNFTVAPRG